MGETRAPSEGTGGGCFDPGERACLTYVGMPKQVLTCVDITLTDVGRGQSGWMHGLVF